MSTTKTGQLNVRIDQALIQQLRQKADAQHCPPGVLVAQALEQFFAREVEVTVLDRLDELERRLAALEKNSKQPAEAEAHTEA